MGSVRTVAAGGVAFGDGTSLPLIAGPCVIESGEHAAAMAAALRDITSRCGVPFVFKASYDKANRTSIRSFRGPGLAEGLRILSAIKADLGVPVLTDIHEPAQAAPVAEVADIVQIPALLARQTDLLVAAAATGRTVNLKKGQFMAPLDMRHAVAKATAAGHDQVIITERGTLFGYRDLVVDVRSFPQLRSLGYPVVFDVTHSVQMPGGGDGASTGRPEFIEPLAAAGVAAGIDALFLEVHDDPASARSDGANALPLDRLEPLLQRLAAISEASHRRLAATAAGENR